MKKFKFTHLLGYERKFKNMLDEFGLKYIPSSRISQYFSYLNKLEKARKLDREKFGEFIHKNKAKYYYSQFYVREICNIVDAIEGSSQDKRIVKEKLKDLVKGTYLLSEENINNTKARNTTFELVLFSFFNSKGLKVRLDDPNPDMKLFTDNFIYNIECKRPYLAKSLEKNIKEAVRQLRKSKDSKSISTLALSLEQIVLGDDLILHSRNEKTALSYLGSVLARFARENLSMVNKICKDEPFLVLYYLSCLSGFEENLPMSHTTHITGNVYNFEENLSSRIYDDLYTTLS